MLTQAWIFANTFSRIHIYTNFAKIDFPCAQTPSSTRISTVKMHGKQTLTCFLALHAFTRDLTFFLAHAFTRDRFDIFFNPVQTARSHRFRPPESLAKIFQHLNPKKSGQNTLFWALARWCACAVVSRNFPGRFKVQKPSHQKDHTQAITKLPQLHLHDSHKSRGDISNIRLMSNL